MHREKDFRVIAVANQKGGVGKTTTAITLASYLANKGIITMIMDCDPQSNVALFLGLPHQDNFKSLMVDDKNMIPRNSLLQSLKSKGYPRLAVITGGEGTKDVQAMFTNREKEDRPRIMRSALERFKVKDQKVVFILDTSPSYNALQEAALRASDYVVIPSNPEAGSEAGVISLITFLSSKATETTVLGVIPNMYDSRVNDHKKSVAAMKHKLGDLVFDPVRSLSVFKYAARKKVPVWQVDDKGQAAKDLTPICEGVLKHGVHS